MLLTRDAACDGEERRKEGQQGTGREPGDVTREDGHHVAKQKVLVLVLVWCGVVLMWCSADVVICLLLVFVSSFGSVVARPTICI